MKKTVYLLLGCAGSGKSWRANELSLQRIQISPHQVSIVSADFYFTPKTVGRMVYGYSPEQLGDAHRFCQNQFIMCLKADIPFIIVDNTNLKYDNIAKYAERAVIEGYNIEIIEPQTDWKYDAEECFKRCQHNVPLETIKTMLLQLKNLKLMHPKMFENPTEYFQDELSIQHTGY